MTLVLSMNPFCDDAASEGEPTLPRYQPIWESERCSKSCVSSPSPLECAVEQLAEEPPCRRSPDHVTTSRIAYFKRKYVEDEDPALSFRNYCQTVSPALEERALVLRLSLEKMRFIDDPEAFLRRSVLVNNLLRRLRAEILLQSEWCFPHGPAPIPAPAPAPIAPWEAQSLSPPRPGYAPQGPYRKRFRLVRGEAPECLQTCCCFYGGGYLRLPLSVYQESCSTSSTSSSFSSVSSPAIPEALLAEGREIRLDSIYPGLDPPETGRLPGPPNPKERARPRERTAHCERDRRPGKVTADRQCERAEVAGHSRWSAEVSEFRQEPTAWGHAGRKL